MVTTEEKLVWAFIFMGAGRVVQRCEHMSLVVVVFVVVVVVVVVVTVVTVGNFGKFRFLEISDF